MAKTQAKGSATRLLIDFETSPGVVPDFEDRNPIVVPFNSTELQAARSLQRAETIRGDRSASEPFQGFKDVSGNLTIPIDAKLFGRFLKLAFGSPTTTDACAPARSHLVGAPTLTISTGTGTFSVGQTTAVVGDRVVYSSGGTIYTAYLTAKSSATQWTVKTTNDASGTNAANVTAATVLFIIANAAAATPGTVTIVSNVATFSEAQAGAVAGAMLIYDGTKRATIKTVNSTTEVVLEGAQGVDVANETAVDVEAIEPSAIFAHAFTVAPVASNPTAVLEVGFTDMEVPHYERFRGCKLNSFSVSVGGEGELLATVNLMGGESDYGYQPYDRESHQSGTPTVTIASGTPYTATFSESQGDAVAGDVIVYLDATGEEQKATIASGSGTSFNLSGAPVTGTTLEVVAVYPGAAASAIAQSRVGDRFQQFDASTYFDGSYVKLFAETTFEFSNNLDGDQYLIGGGGTREEIPEGLATVTGTLSGVFKSNLIIDKAKGFETSSLEIRFTRGTTGQTLSLLASEIKMQEKSPAVSGPAGVQYDPSWEGFKRDSDSIVTVTLTGPELSY